MRNTLEIVHKLDMETNVSSHNIHLIKSSTF